MNTEPSVPHQPSSSTDEASGRLMFIPGVMVCAATYAVLVLLYLAVSDSTWNPPTNWVYPSLRIALALSVMALLVLIWRFSRPSRRVMQVFDRIGAGLLAIAFGWLTGSVNDMLITHPTQFPGRMLLPSGWMLWSAAGVVLTTVGISRLSGNMLSEHMERRRLQSLMEFTPQMSSLDYQVVLNEAVRHLYDLLEADACVLFLWDEAEQLLVPSAGIHDPAVYTDEYVRNMMAFKCPVGHGLTGRVFESGRPYITGDVYADPHAQMAPGAKRDERSSLLAPMQVEGRRLGVVRGTRRGLNRFSRDDLELTVSFANQAALVLEHVRIVKQLSDQSTTDSLTGLYNARHFESVLTSEIARCDRDGQPLALIMIDSDSLKKLNDQFGHQKGNEYLRGIARVIRDSIRACDHAFRYAGDEFLVLLPATGAEAAMLVAERIRRMVEERESLPGIAGTVSVGVAILPVHAHDAEALLAAADRAMYESKRLGKNRVTSA